MTAAPSDRSEPQQPHLLTVAEYAALDETELGYTELYEGRLLLSPSPVPDHSYAVAELVVALRQACPPGFDVLPDVDVDLQLVPPDEPGFVRRPDLAVVRSDARRRTREKGGLLRASDAVLVVEVVSPGSRRTDYVAKRNEYADAGIPHYWIVDLRDPVSLLTCHLAGELGYADDGEIAGTFRTTQPFGLELDLSRLT